MKDWEFWGGDRGWSRAIVACAVICAASAAGAETITLKQGYERMLSSEIELKSLGIEDSIAQEIVRQAKAQRYPRVGAAATGRGLRTIRRCVASHISGGLVAA